MLVKTKNILSLLLLLDLGCTELSLTSFYNIIMGWEDNLWVNKSNCTVAWSGKELDDMITSRQGLLHKHGQ